MRTIFITLSYLDKPSGGCYASSAHINAFHKISDSFLLLFPYRGKEPKYIESGINKIPVQSNTNKIIKGIKLIIGEINRFNHCALKFLDSDYDTVVFDSSLVSYRLITKFKKAGKRVFTIHHNYQYEYLKDNSKGLLGTISLFWCKKYEKEAVRSSDINIVLTAQDKELLRLHYGTGNEVFKVLGTFEYMEYINDTDSESSYKMNEDHKNNGPLRKFIITGSLGSIQTNDSLIPWLKTYYPLLRDRYPLHKLILAGRDPSSQLYELCSKYNEITIIANPKDMNAVIKDCDYYICPTSLGGGLKLRIMDGLKNGLPICTHRVSSRGYDIFKDHCLFDYSDEKTFIEAIDKVIDCKLSKDSIKSIYKSDFSFSAGVKRLKNITELL